MSELLDFILGHEDAFKSKARLTSLYSDFANLKATNPDGYAANASAWRSALVKASRAGVTPGDNLLTFHSGEKLLKELEVKGLGRPSALGSLLHDAVVAKQMIPLKEFLESKTNIYNKSWIPTLPSVWDIARWGLRQIGIVGSSNDKLIEGDYVVMANVEEATTRLLSCLQRNPNTATSLIYSMTTFTHSFSSVLSLNSKKPLSPNDMTILLTHLRRDKHLAITSTSPDSTTTIKLAQEPFKNQSIITTHEQTIATLQTLSLTLTSSITALETRISSLTTPLNTALAASNRPLALTYLRARKAATATLLLREASLHQTRGVLDAIDDAASNVEMVRAMEAGAGVLADLNAEVGGAEGVQRVMDAVREGVIEAEEINGAIGELGAENVDEGEVQAEMVALEEEERNKVEAVKKEAEEKSRDEEQEKAKILENALPSVPFGMPETRKTLDVDEEKNANKLSSEGAGTPRQHEMEPALTA